MSEFKYTDKDDKLTEALISSEYDGEYWGKSEDLVLARAETYLLTRFGREALSEMTLLDLGCGMGRLIPRFAPLFGHVVGLEPDAERCAAAEKLVAEEHISNAEVHNCDCGAWLLENPDSRFDVVLCSHIFQHISHDTLGGILLDLQRCTHAQTAFVFTTTYVYGEENEYSTEFFEAGKRQTVIRTYDEFVDAIGHEGVLPVCRFAKPWLTHYLRGFGYESRTLPATTFTASMTRSATLRTMKMRPCRRTRGTRCISARDWTRLPSGRMPPSPERSASCTIISCRIRSSTRSAFPRARRTSTPQP